MEHVRRLRLERAAHRLKSSADPVTRIAFEAGYETHEAFTRAFRAMFDDSPSGFRQLHRRYPVRPVVSDVHFNPDGPIESFRPASGSPPMDIRLEQMSAMRVAFVRHIGPYQGVGEAWGRLCGWAGRRGLLGAQALCVGISYDDPEITPPDKIRYDACLSVGPNVQPEGDVGVQEIAGGEYAVATHHGPHERLGETYAALYGQWLPASSRQPRSSPAIEIYRNSPQDTPPEQLVTDICVPLEPASSRRAANGRLGGRALRMWTAA